VHIQYEPTLGDTYTKPVVSERNNSPVNVTIRDTAGIYHFAAMRDADIKIGAVFIVTFAVDNLFQWKEVPEVIENIRKIQPKAIILLVGTKSDLKDRALKDKIAEEFAQKGGMSYLECSAKDNKGVDKVFNWAVAQLK